MENQNPDVKEVNGGVYNYGNSVSDDETVPQTTAIGKVSSINPNEEESGRCGWLGFTPECLQKFRRPEWVLFFLCVSSFTQGMNVNGFVNITITTLEKRFDLPSSTTGLFASVYDVGYLLLCIPVTYFGSAVGSSKPRYLGSGMMILGIGSLVYLLPHLLVEPYQALQVNGGDALELCLASSGNVTTLCGTEQEQQLLSHYKYFFLLGQFLHGVGACPLYTLAITYVDENLKSRQSPFYVGIFYSMAVFGPAVGFVLGGQFLRLYVDFPTRTPGVGMTPGSRLWIGAWWLGFVVTAVCSFVAAIPLLAFPPHLPGYAEIQAGKVSETHQKTQEKELQGFRYDSLKDLPKSCLMLIKNPTFSFLSLAGASEGFVIAGVVTFMPKFAEAQFNISPSYSSLIIGVLAVSAGAGGTFLGGFLVRKLDLRCSGILKMCILAALACLLFAFFFFFNCGSNAYAGVNTSYNSSVGPIDVIQLWDECNAACGCSQSYYEPICSHEGTDYFSPCHAGCSIAEIKEDGLKVFSNCSCIPSAPELLYEAKGEQCQKTCSQFPIFFGVSFFFILLTFVQSTPAIMGTIRCVADRQRSVALGIQWILVRALGSIPGPVVFGKFIDETCELWQTSCDNTRGSCRSYDNFWMARYMLILSICGKLLTLSFYIIAWYFYVPPVLIKREQTQETVFTIEPQVELASYTETPKTPEQTT